MPYYCTVPRCTSMAGKAKNVSFHQFPRDEELAELWNKILKRGKPYTKYSKVCSLHFTPEDYTITSVGKNKGQWRTLRKDAIPSQNLPSESPTPYQRKQWGGWPPNNPANVLDPTIQQQVAQAIYMQTMLAMQAAGTAEVPTLNHDGIPPLQVPAEAPLAHTSTANDTDILKGKQTNTNELNNSYKCTECSKCFKDPDVYTLHKRGHIKNEKNEKENFNINVTLQANPILANLLKTNTENGFDNNLMSIERLLITALAANMEGYMRNFATMIKKECRGDLSHDRGDLSHDSGDLSLDRGDLSHDRGDLSHDRGDLSLDRDDLSHVRGDSNLDRGDMSHDRGDMSLDRDDLSNGRGDSSLDRGDMSHDTGDISDDRGGLGYNMGNLNQDRSSLSNGEYVQDRLNLRDSLNQDGEITSQNGVLSQESDRSDSNHDRNTVDCDRSDANNDRNGLNNDTGSLVNDADEINSDTVTSNMEHRNDTNLIRDRIIELYRNNDAYDNNRNIRYYENDQQNGTEYPNSDSVTNYDDSDDRGMKNGECEVICKEGIYDRGVSDERGTNDNEAVMYVEQGLIDERGIISDEEGIISDVKGINDSQGLDGPNCDSDFCESIDSNKLIIDETF